MNREANPVLKTVNKNNEDYTLNQPMNDYLKNDFKIDFFMESCATQYLANNINIVKDFNSRAICVKNFIADGKNIFSRNC